MTDMRGFFGIGIYRGKSEVNVGTLWRSAYSFGAGFIFTVGRRYPKQASDTTQTWRHVPLLEYADIDDLLAHLPYDCPLVGVELHESARPLAGYGHPERACYLLGAEDNGLPPGVVERCHSLVQIEMMRPHCLNVATAGSLVMYSRHLYRAGLHLRPR